VEQGFPGGQGHSGGQGYPQGQQPSGQQPAGQAQGGAAKAAGGRKLGLIIGAAVVVILLVIALVWFLVARSSPEAKAEREISDTLTSLGSVESFSEFGEKICAQYKPSQELTDQLATISKDSGVDFDQQFTEQIRSSFPSSLEVTGVDLDGDDATAHIKSTSDEGQETEEDTKMRREDGKWLVCDPAVDTNGQPETPGA